jgi:hypothetical protein
MFPVLYMTTMTAERTFNLQSFTFPVLPRFVPVFHQEENNRAVADKRAGVTVPALGFFLSIPGRFILLNHKRTCITAAFTPVYLADAPTCDPVNLDTPADRAADHLQQLYVAYKETIG